MAKRTADDEAERRSATDGSRLTRRAVLATGGALSAMTLAGCLGGGGTPTVTDTGTTEPQAPYTTEGLAGHIDGDEELTIYAGTGDDQQWHELVEVVNDEFGTHLTAEVFASDGGEVSQRIVQERQADSDKWDLGSATTDITDKVRSEGQSVAEKYFEFGMDEDFWFSDLVAEERLLPWLVGPFNGGASSVMNVNVDIFDEKDLDYPTSYNDLFGEAYAGLTTMLPSFIVPKEVGWIAKFHAEERGMDPVDWMEELMAHLDFTGADSYGPAVRTVAQGDAAIDFHNFPWFASSFIDEYDSLRGVFVDPVKEEGFGGDLAINRHAPNPWAARFLTSAYFEEPVQRRLVDEVTDQVPARTDVLDIESMDLDDYTKRRLTTETDLIGFQELTEYTEVYQDIQASGVLDDY